MAERQLLSSIMNKPLKLVTDKHFQPGYLGLIDETGTVVAILNADHLFDGENENRFVRDI